jgi:hypothetical protein
LMRSRRARSTFEGSVSLLNGIRQKRDGLFEGF